MTAAGTGIRLRHVRRLADLPASAWDALFSDPYPFTRHAWLSGLEVHGCVGGDSGWDPHHLVAEDATGKLRGAVPCYLKHHSYGEFVFDFAWADASHRLRRAYYPKAVCAVPFVPSSGPRIAADAPEVHAALARALSGLAAGQKLSSTHVLFAGERDAVALRENAFLERHDTQFHWHDRGFGDFAGFVGTMSSDKRKKLLRERRRVAESGIAFEVRRGADLSDADWAHAYRLYANTYHERGQPPYFTRAFLAHIGRDPALDVRLVCAMEGRRWVALALTMVGGDTLYGRHWGAEEHHHSLHFECCYYQGIDLCLREGLRRFDAGTQGAHKLGRGFDPVQTRSFHELADPRLREAVADYLARERRSVAARAEDLMHHTPYRESPDS